MKFNYSAFYIFLILSTIFISCNDDENPGIANPYEQGVFVLNEGNFQSGNASVTHINILTQEVDLNVYSTNNDAQDLGDVAQSIEINESNAYIVVNNSNKVEVVEAETMENIATIDNLSLPRYIAFSGDKGYISEWVSFSDPGRVAVFDVVTNAIESTIEVGFGAEYLHEFDGNLYVGNNFENTISVIDLASGAVVDQIEVAPSPGYILQDIDGALWVICSGGFNADFTPANNGALYKIDPATNSVIDFYEFGTNVSGRMAVNGQGDILYYFIGNDVYQLDINATSLPSGPFITNNNFVGVYSIGVDPIEESIYISDNLGFTSNGKIYSYSPDGSLQNTYEAGIGPNDFAFLPH